uniref:Uncharacterized protein n=1 Tax=Meloidogyne hapla TaxID=6305 RepID=A0A1I8BLE8_MELHA
MIFVPTYFELIYYKVLCKASETFYMTFIGIQNVLYSKLNSQTEEEKNLAIIVENQNLLVFSILYKNIIRKYTRISQIYNTNYQEDPMKTINEEIKKLLEKIYKIYKGVDKLYNTIDSFLDKSVKFIEDKEEVEKNIINESFPYIKEVPIYNNEKIYEYMFNIIVEGAKIYENPMRN